MCLWLFGRVCVLGTRCRSSYMLVWQLLCRDSLWKETFQLTVSYLLSISLKHLISQIWLLPSTSPSCLTSSCLFLANLPTDCVRDSRTKAVLGKQHQILFKRTCNYGKMHKNGILIRIYVKAQIPTHRPHYIEWHTKTSKTHF